jgi:hypothetical protein
MSEIQVLLEIGQVQMHPETEGDGGWLKKG